MVIFWLMCLIVFCNKLWLKLYSLDVLLIMVVIFLSCILCFCSVEVSINLVDEVLNILVSMCLVWWIKVEEVC